MVQGREAADENAAEARWWASGPRLAGALVMVVLLVVGCFPGVAFGQALLNPRFDADLAGWSTGTAHSWSSEDCSDSTTSGSLFADKDYASSSLLNAKQCFELGAGEELSFDVQYLIPAISEEAEIWISISFWQQPDCSDLISFAQEGPFLVQGSWATASVPLVQSPPGTVAAAVHVGVIELWDDVVPVAAHFDNAFLGPYLFADGFEAGNTSRWSTVVH